MKQFTYTYGMTELHAVYQNVCARVILCCRFNPLSTIVRVVTVATICNVPTALALRTRTSLTVSNQQQLEQPRASLDSQVSSIRHMVQNCALARRRQESATSALKFEPRSDAGRPSLRDAARPGEGGPLS